MQFYFIDHKIQCDNCSTQMVKLLYPYPYTCTHNGYNTYIHSKRKHASSRIVWDLCFEFHHSSTCSSSSLLTYGELLFLLCSASVFFAHTPTDSFPVSFYFIVAAAFFFVTCYGHRIEILWYSMVVFRVSVLYY